MEIRPFAKKHFHLAGVVPVAKKREMHFEWHDSLMPISEKETAAERAVRECLLAGCETIWVICDHEVKPLLRKVLGEYKWSLSNTRVPIYYAGIRHEDKHRVDDITWSVLYGAWVAYNASERMARWLIPGKFYISFPYGVYEPQVVEPYTKLISSPNNFMLANKGHTAKDGKYLGFTFGAKEWNLFRDWYSEMEENDQSLKLDNILSCVKIEDSDKIVEVSWYNRIDTWDKYRHYMHTWRKV